MEAKAKADADEAELIEMAQEVGAAALHYAEGRGPLQYKSSGEVAPFSETLHEIKFAPLQTGRYVWAPPTGASSTAQRRTSTSIRPPSIIHHYPPTIHHHPPSTIHHPPSIQPTTHTLSGTSKTSRFA